MIRQFYLLLFVFFSLLLSNNVTAKGDCTPNRSPTQQIQVGSTQLECEETPEFKNQLVAEISFVEVAGLVREFTTQTQDCISSGSITLEMAISTAPSTDVEITLTASGTAQTLPAEADYLINDLTVTFPAGMTDNQTITVVVYDDNNVESLEDIVLDYTIDSGDAIKGAANQTYTLYIRDNDVPIVPVGTVQTFFEEDFIGGIPYFWQNNELIAGNGTFEYTKTKPAGFGITVGLGGFTTETNGFVAFDSGATADGLPESTELIFAPINCMGYDSIGFNFELQYCTGMNDLVSIQYSTDGVNFTTKFDGSVFPSNFCTSNPLYGGIDFTAEAVGQSTFYVKFKFEGLDDRWFLFDDVSFIGKVAPKTIETALSSSPTQTSLNPSSTIEYYDETTGNIMMKLENSSGTMDYGCTSVSINRAGLGAVEAWSADVADYITEKTYNVTPETNSATGVYWVTLYYTTDEINGWMAATGRGLFDLRIIKTNSTFDNIQAADVRSFETTTVNAISGGYSFRARFFDGFSSFALGSTESIGEPLLPIELLYFTANKEREGIQLDWATLSEVDADIFEIQHSKNGISFESIAEMSAEGEPNLLTEYDYLDRDFVYGENYYRLKLIGLSGLVTYSNIVNVSLDRISGNVTVFPNPIKGDAKVRILGYADEMVDFEVTNALGQVVQSKVYTLVEGENFLQLDATDLDPGIYFITVKRDELGSVYKFIKH